jgi:hypothetical protein
MAEWLGFPAPLPHVVPLPEPDELGAAVEQFSDQRGDLRIAWCAGRELAEVGGDRLGGMIPVGKQLPGGRVEERVPDRVAPLGRPVRQPREQGEGLGIGG